ncbi:hypothetical protein M885DRAFT_561790 [Pelagophyceae sp. CCMP2097]|nr:hypothetical protein M885DRAFT_561790 [Pelagophyceae sp. CCMP2097]
MDLRNCAYCYASAAGFKACSKCGHRFYCSREHQVLDWKKGHKHWCGKAGELGYDFEVRAAEGKGLGLFALRDFQRCEKILVERPVITVDKHDAAALARVRLPPDEAASVQTAVDALAPGSGDLRRTFETNCCALDDGDSAGGLFVHFSRVNHDCVGNSAHVFVPEHGLMLLVANFEISRGAEVTFSYCEQVPSKAERAWKLQFAWGFSCACAACNDAGLGAKLDRVYDLDAAVARLGSTGNVAASLRAGRALVCLYDELRLPRRLYSRTFYDMFQIAISKRAHHRDAFKFIKLYPALSHEHAQLYYGCDCQEVRMKAKLVADPSSHRNYNPYN